MNVAGCMAAPPMKLILIATNETGRLRSPSRFGDGVVANGMLPARSGNTRGTPSFVTPPHGWCFGCATRTRPRLWGNADGYGQGKTSRINRLGFYLPISDVLGLFVFAGLLNRN